MSDERSDYGGQPELTDGTVVLRPWRDEDIEPARLGHDAEIARAFDLDPTPPSREQQAEAVHRWRSAYADDRTCVNFVVEHDGTVVGNVEVRRQDGRIGHLSWTLYAGHRGRGYATRAVRMLVDYAIEDLALHRIEAYVAPDNESSLRVATRAGLRREGLLRGHEAACGAPTDRVLFARLADDPPVTDPASFRSLLNSFLPRKRAISQMLIRDTGGRVLLCQLTYKQDWDLPGGVVEVGESPQVAVTREVTEELDLGIRAGSLVLTDWLPPWGGWDDAICLVFDGGVHDPGIVSDIVRQEREIRSAQFCTLEQVRQRCADFTARRIDAALANLGAGSPAYTESGAERAQNSADASS